MCRLKAVKFFRIDDVGLCANALKGLDEVLPEEMVGYAVHKIPLLRFR